MYDKVCKKCGTYLSDFYRTGMLGCPECYNYFRDEVVAALKKCQYDTYHDGKTPKLSDADRQLLSEFHRLIKEKEQASIDGDFSRVKRISDRLYVLTDELKQRGLI